MPGDRHQDTQRPSRVLSWSCPRHHSSHGHRRQRCRALVSARRDHQQHWLCLVRHADQLRVVELVRRAVIRDRCRGGVHREELLQCRGQHQVCISTFKRLVCSYDGNSVFGDPCPDTAKNLNVQAQCSDANWIGGSVAEGASLALACPANQNIVSIEYASYGTPAGTYPNFVSTWCDAPDSAAQAAAICVGHNACTLDANSGYVHDIATCRGLMIDTNLVSLRTRARASPSGSR